MSLRFGLAGLILLGTSGVEDASAQASAQEIAPAEKIAISHPTGSSSRRKATARLWRAPAPSPRGPGIVLFSHYLGTALLAGAIALRVRRPNRQMWYVAALLSGYVLFNAIVAVWRMLGPDAAALGKPGTIALAVGGFLWATQVLAAFCLYAAREVRTMQTVPRRR